MRQGGDEVVGGDGDGPRGRDPRGDDRQGSASGESGTRLGLLLAGLLLVLGAIGLPVTAVRALGDLGGPGAALGETVPFVQLVAFTPWFALPCLAGLLVAALARRRVAAAAFGVTVAAHALWLLPAVVATGPGAREVDLTVVAANAYGGGVDAPGLVDLVRRDQVDVLVVVELTEELAADLREAGVEAELPHAALTPAASAAGSGIWSRHPLTGLPGIADSTFAMPRAEVFPDAPSGEPGTAGTGVVVTAVHVVPPVPGATGSWRSELSALADVADETAQLHVMAGDFNATRDHAPYRAVVRAVGRDTADDRGWGLRPTWPAGSAVLTLDHVLVSRQVRVGETRTVELDGTDHLAVVATLDLPDDPEPDDA